MGQIRITLRLRIFLAMMLIILLSFVLTGTISYYHFKQENELYHQERLKRKDDAINESIRYFLRNQLYSENSDSLVKLFDDKICELADINNLDINLYSMSGALLISSNPELYERKIIPENLGSSLLNALEERSQQLLVSHEHDTIKYISTYDYIHNGNNDPIAIISLPYFDTSNIARQDLTGFMIPLIQIYLVLFIGAGLLAYFLSNYIIGSLRAIGQQMQRLKLNEPNPPLKWRFDDELGTLVAEYNRMLRELEKSVVKLAQTERESAWKEMAKQVAHEIKNPLTPMRLNVQYLEKTLKTENKEQLKEFTASMINQIDTLSSIAEAFSRFANMPELKPEEFSVREIIERTTTLYPNDHISFNCSDPNIKMIGDKDQLVRVMNNLINNALQAIPEGRDPDVRVSLTKNDDHILIEVSDNGTGVPEDQRSKIFEPRFTTKTKGMGLGLAMVKNIIDLFGGEIWFESEIDKGTTFYISLPDNT